MTSCAACRADCRHTSDVCPLSSRACVDCLCEACVARLFRKDNCVSPCPMCGCNTKVEGYSDLRPAMPADEPVENLRRQISGIYCKKQEDFADVAEYNDYLEQREHLISRLGNPSSVEDVQDVWRHVDQYEEENREQIRRAHGFQPRRKSRKKTADFIVEEGRSVGQWNADSPQQPFGSASPQQSFGSACHQLQEPPGSAWKTADDSGIWAPDSPSSPQVAMIQQHKSRHMSGGGATPNTRLKKARHYFFKDLVAGSRALAMAPSPQFRN